MTTATERLARVTSGILVVVIAAMLLTFFSCGGGDDDDDSSNAASCSEAVQNFKECRPNWFGPSTPDYDQGYTCLKAWCEGGSYEDVGPASLYDFNTACFPADCAAMYDFIFDVYSEMYDDCRIPLNNARFDGYQCMYD